MFSVQGSEPCRSAVTFTVSTFSHADAGNSSNGAPHVVPALLTRMSRFDSRSETASMSSRHCSSLLTSQTIAWASPS